MRAPLEVGRAVQHGEAFGLRKLVPLQNLRNVQAEERQQVAQHPLLPHMTVQLSGVSQAPPRDSLPT